MMAFSSYTSGRGTTLRNWPDKRVVRKRPAPGAVKAAVRRVKKAELSEPALRWQNELRGLWNVDYDRAGGRRYRRQDEIGTPPFCITVRLPVPRGPFG